MLVHNETWLIVECKHVCRNRDIELLLKKVDYIYKNKREKWVTKGLDEPAYIIVAVCSVGEFSKVPLSTEQSLTTDETPRTPLKFIRTSLGYEVLIAEVGKRV